MKRSCGIFILSFILFTRMLFGMMPSPPVAVQQPKGETWGQMIKRQATRPIMALKEKAENIHKTMIEKVERNYPDFTNTLNKNKEATIRVGANVAAQEKNATKVRLASVRKTLTNKIGKSPYVPKIAVVTSGGGVRASLASSGALSGLDDAGLLDAVLWVSTLSGSTWSVGSWFQSMLLNPELSINEHSKNLIDYFTGTSLGFVKPVNLKKMVPVFIVDAVFGMPITLVDLYGAFVGNRVLQNFGEKRQSQYLSSQAKLFGKRSLPIPIYTAVNGEGNSHEYWYAYTPWEISFEPWKIGGNGFSAPTWSFGREFDKGKSVGFKPEKTLGSHLGTFGSAFAADAKTIIQHSFLIGVENKIAKSIVDFVIRKQGTARVSFGMVYNFMKNIEEAPLKDQRFIKLVDAGLAFNLPYPPISGLRAERKADIIIFVDADGDLERLGAIELKRVEAYARKKGLKFPKINYTDIVKREMSIFKDETDPSVPVVIYMPFVKNSAFNTQFDESKFPQFSSLRNFNTRTCCSTAKGSIPAGGMYTAQGATDAVKLMRYNVLKNREAIWNEIKQRANVGTLFEKVAAQMPLAS